MCILSFIGELIYSMMMPQNETVESSASFPPKTSETIDKPKLSEFKSSNSVPSSYYSEAWSSHGNLQSKSLSEPEINVSGLDPSTKYYYKVAAVDNSGNIGKLSGIKSNKNNANLHLSSNDNVPPTQVTGLSIFIVNSSHLDLNWIANTDSDLDHYNIYQHTSPNFPVIPGFTPPIGTSTINSFSISGLDPSTKYYYKVAAVDNSGNTGAVSLEKSGYTLSQLPSRPFKIRELAVNQNEVKSMNEKINSIQEMQKFPSILEPISSVLQRNTYVTDGIVIMRNSSYSYIGFERWGLQNNLALDVFYKNNEVGEFYRLTGSTGNMPSGYISDELNYTGRYVSIFFGQIVKTPDRQLSIALDVLGEKGRYKFFFINGYLNIMGLRGNNYYSKIIPNSSRLIDLIDIISGLNDRYIALEKIEINVQNNAQINKFEFRIDLGKSTVNTPILVPGGGSFYVIGHVLNEGPVLSNFRYLINNLELKKALDIRFNLKSNHYKIVDSGWEITNRESNVSSHGGIVSITAKRPLSMEEFNPWVILQLDIPSSLKEMRQNDLLFLFVFVIGSSLLIAQSNFLSVRKTRQ
jgi:chitodextrinase